MRNNVFKSDHVEAIYNDRLSICNSCENKDNEGLKCAIPETHPCCSLCGCSLSIKLRSLSTECPANKWSAVVTQQEEDFIKHQIEKNETKS